MVNCRIFPGVEVEAVRAELSAPIMSTTASGTEAEVLARPPSPVAGWVDGTAGAPGGSAPGEGAEGMVDARSVFTRSAARFSCALAAT